MAKHKFKPGNQAAKGVTLPTVDHRQETKLTTGQFQAAINKYMKMQVPELKAILADPKDVPAYEVMALNILVRAMSGGDISRAGFLLDRLLGKVPDKIEVDVNDERKQALATEMANDLLKARRK